MSKLQRIGEDAGAVGRQLAPLTAEGKRYLVRDHMAAVVQLALALGFARSLGWFNAWLYGGLLVAGKVTSALLLTRINPAVVNARGVRHPMSTRERVFFSVYIPTSLSIPIIAGLEVGGPGWTHYSAMELVVGAALWTVGTGAIVWALAVNAFFEPTVRIQRERGHRVCGSGPYRFIRHPGYAGAIALTAGIPLLLGSRWCFVPVAVVTVAFIVRTVYEDRLLREELGGYDAYAAETQYRLLPLVW